MSQLFTQGGSSSSNAQGQLVSRLSSVSTDIQNVADIADKAIDACKLVGTDLEELNETDKVGEVDESLRMLLSAKKRMDIEIELLSQTMRHADADDVAQSYERSWKRSVTKYEKQSDAQKFGRNGQYREFREQVWEVNHEGEPMPSLFEGGEDSSDDEDLVVSGARLTYKCPISMAWLNNPVTSRTCKHSYSKDSIMSMLRARHGSCPCPVAGCSHTVNVRDLQPDRLLERKVARHLRQLEIEQSQTEYTLIR